LKRVGYLYEQIYDFGNLYCAYLKARRDKRFRRETMRFTTNLEENLITLQNELIWKTYVPHPAKEFCVRVPKPRVISAPSFRDRVLHHAIHNVIGPLFDRTFISHSYACRNQKGTHAAVDRFTRYLRKAAAKHDKVYCLKGDISKYFPSIDRGILLEIVKRKVKDPSLLWLIKRVLDANHDETGIGIGALTSQLFANVYLNELDHFVKERLRVKYYIRYMDDFVIVGPDKAELHSTRQEIETFLWARLRLKTNSKTQVLPISKGIGFLGYRIWPTHRLLKTDAKKRIKKAFKGLMKRYGRGEIGVAEVKSSVQSYLAHIAHADSYRFKRTLLKGFVLQRDGKREPD